MKKVTENMVNVYISIKKYTNTKWKSRDGKNYKNKVSNWFLISNLLYSPDLAISGIFLFLNLKIWVGGKTFSSKHCLNKNFFEFNNIYFLSGMKIKRYALPSV